MDFAKFDYTTPDGALYEFLYVDGGPSFGWRIYVLNDIDYGERDSSFEATRLVYEEDEEYPYIFYHDPIATLDEARTSASLWADATNIYIQDGGNSCDEVSRRLLFEEVTRRLTKGTMDRPTYEHVCQIIGYQPSETT